MGTLPTPSPNTFPNRGPVPNPNPVPIQTAAPGVKSPSFEEVSKLFSLPFSDAADSLGVCPSVLKKVCYDNGLVRWPYRNFMAGKSIEDIKKEAAIEKEKQLAKLKVAPERNVSSASPVVSTSLSPPLQSTSTSSLQENPATRMLTQQPNRDNQIVSFHAMHSSTTNKGSAPSSDEFKYGFPLNGLSSITYRWWGNNGDIENGSCDGDAKRKQQPEDSVDNGTNLSSTETTEGKKNETDVDPQWQSSLSALRKKAAKEGQQTVKLVCTETTTSKPLIGAKKCCCFRYSNHLCLVNGEICPLKVEGECREDVSDGTMRQRSIFDCGGGLNRSIFDCKHEIHLYVNSYVCVLL